jgi:phage-related minor tail protein
LSNAFKALQQSSSSGGWLSTALSYFNKSAHGNVFAAAGISALSNGIYNQPTFFAKGGNVLGEAGPEAVMPLTRDASGNLGVKVQGDGATQNVVNVTVNVNSDGSGDTTAQGNDAQMRALGNVIGAKVRDEMANQMKPGGMLWRQSHA